jgi:hypothetical protein
MCRPSAGSRHLPAPKQSNNTTPFGGLELSSESLHDDCLAHASWRVYEERNPLFATRARNRIDDGSADGLTHCRKGVWRGVQLVFVRNFQRGQDVDSTYQIVELTNSTSLVTAQLQQIGQSHS